MTVKINMRTINCNDDNIESIRLHHPEGLHFAVGDIHGEAETLVALMEKIRFDPAKDHVYFVGDYNAGGNVTQLIRYMSKYYQEDNDAPGFHMIRGNHERELYPNYPLENLPDIIVIRGKALNFYIVHAGMASGAFELINSDIDKDPKRKVFAYRLDDSTCCFNAPFRQIVWSMRGFYSQRPKRHRYSDDSRDPKMQGWPSEDKLKERNACIIHGHSPYCFFMGSYGYGSSYGDDTLFWEQQHMFFCRELHSFNIDSNIKGRYENAESYRGLSCLCLETFDETAAVANGTLTVDNICQAENGVFAVELVRSYKEVPTGDPNAIFNARPQMKTITLNEQGVPILVD